MKRSKWMLIGTSILIVLVVLLLLWSFARKAEPANDSEWLTSTLIAHRGMHNSAENIPENSLAAFRKAIESGYIIELDVSMTKDQQLVVYHDKKLKRLFGLDSYLVETDYKELAKLTLPNSTENIPLFSEVLEYVNGQVPLLIEIKNEGDVGVMEQMINDELKDYQGKYAIQSFNPYTVGWFREHAPHVLRGQLSGSFIVSDYDVEYAGTTRLPWYKKILLSNLLLNFESRPNFIAYEVENIESKTFKNIKKLGVPVLAWTIKDKEEYEKIKDVIDNFIVEIFDLD